MTNWSRAAQAKPLYGQVREMLLDRIAKGEWGPGESLPNEFLLAQQFDVSVGTIRRAVEGLEESGVVVRKQGRGTYVSGQGASALEQRFSRLRSTQGRPLQIAYDLLGVERRLASETERVRLILDAQDEVLVIRQLLRTPLAVAGLEQSVVPSGLFPNLEAALTTGQPLYAVYCLQGVLVVRADDAIRFSAATSATASPLGLQVGQIVIAVERVALDMDGRAIELRTSSFVPSAVSLSYAV